MVWFKYARPEFRCVERYLISQLPNERNPLALSAFAFLFYSLGKKSLLHEALSKLSDEINHFVDIQHSAMRLRNCLVISAYLCISRKAKQDLEISDEIVNAHLDYAAGSKWFGDPRLPVIVAKLPVPTEYASTAYAYLRGHIHEWTRQDNTLGVLCYSIVETQNVSDEVINYLRLIQWSEVKLEILTWALMAVGTLVKRGYSLKRTQRSIVEEIFGILWKSSAVGGMIGERNINALEATSSELAFAAYVLKHQGFDEVIGFPVYQESVLANFVKLRIRLMRGGVVLSKRLFVFLQIETLVVLVVLAWWLIQKLGITGLYAVLLELVVLALFSAFGYWYFNRRQPAVGALAEIFSAEMENTGENAVDEFS